MERLYTEFLLWKHGFYSGERYTELLNKMFLDDLDNEFLLELEECSTNILDTSGCFTRYWTYEYHKLDIQNFGKHLFSTLKSIYNANVMSIEKFGTCFYCLWRELPSPINQTEPFKILCYADDPLSYGDVAQTKKFYEEAFALADKIFK